MAPPRHRRPGFSRKARLGLFAGYVVAVAGLLVGLGLILIARFDQRGFTALHGVATDLTSPIGELGRATVRGVRGISEEISAYWNAGAQNAELRREMARSRARLVEARLLTQENARLKRLVKLVEATPETVVATRVVGSSASSARRMVTLTAGSLAGVRPGQPVRALEGLIGRVVETGRISSHVLLLTDAGSTVPGLLVRNGAPVLATGHGDGRIDLRALVAGQAPFRRGDVVATSGTGGVYPAGIPVAVITDVNRDSATGWPLADPARIDFALVMRAYEPDIPPPPPAPRGP